MKKVINWFKKRTVIKLLIVQCAACTIGFLIVGKFGAALFEFALFLSWILIDLGNNTIETKDEAIRMLAGDLADERKKLAGERENTRNAFVYANFCMLKYLREKAKVDFINGKISASEFGKKYNYYTELIEKSAEKNRWVHGEYRV